jgi:hypothetical protein
MELFSLIVDRVENTNIFNVIKGELPNDNGHHLQSVLDQDLIQEFLLEVERIFRLSNNVQSEENRDDYLNLLSELRSTGETFFEQFFPEIIQTKVRQADYMHLFFNLDPSLSHIPWEILHDGSAFLGDKFSLGKSIKSSTNAPTASASPRLNMLIIADPTEELEWARREGEELFERLNKTIPTEKLQIDFLGGSQITKLKLLNALKGKDIIHYCGHLYYNMENAEDNGWQLYNNKVLHAREIHKSGAKPKLVFSNSCLSRNISSEQSYLLDPSSDIASSFLSSGILNYVGTNWEIPDNEKTLEFAMNFYEALFGGLPIGECLLKSRTHCRRNFSINDLTWANYTLYGNPGSVIYKEATSSINISNNIIKPDLVRKKFPTPLATAYHKFIETAGESPQQDLQNLFRVFENTILLFGSVIFANHKYHNLRERPMFTESGSLKLKNYIDLIYESLYDLQSLKLPVMAPQLVQTLYIHRDMIYKLNHWVEEYVQENIQPEGSETYLVTFQYLLDNFLMDCYFIKDYQLYYLFPDETEHLLFRGLETRKRSLYLPETVDTKLVRRIHEARASISLFSPSTKELLNLSPYCTFSFGAGGKGTFEYRNYRSFELPKVNESTES